MKSLLALILFPVLLHAQTYSGEFISICEPGTLNGTYALDSIHPEYGMTNIISFRGAGLSVTKEGFLLTDGRSQTGLSASNYYVNQVCTGASAVTIACVVKPNTQSNALNIIAQIWVSSLFTGINIAFTNGTYVRAGGRSVAADAFQSVGSQTQIGTNKFTHICAVMDYSNKWVELYIDGALSSTGLATWANTAYSPVLATSLPWSIGGELFNANFSCRATIGHVSIWRRKLTRSEIKDHAITVTP